MQGLRGPGVETEMCREGVGTGGGCAGARGEVDGYLVVYPDSDFCNPVDIDSDSIATR